MPATVPSAHSLQAPRFRPLVVRTGAFGDMVLVTVLIGELARRFDCTVDVLTSGPWSEPLLRGQPGVGEILTVRSRKTPYWLSGDQRRAVRHLAARGPGPTWYCDGNDAARSMLRRAGITDGYIVDVKQHPLLPGEHATQQWHRLAHILPVLGVRKLPTQGSASATTSTPGESPIAARASAWAAGAAPSTAGAPSSAAGMMAHPAGASPSALRGPGGCHLTVGDAQRAELAQWLQTRGLGAVPLIAIQPGNKRTMRQGLRRLAANSKYWPGERWAAVLRQLRARHPDHIIVLLGTGPEYELNQGLMALAGSERLYNAARDLPIPRLLALLEHVRGLITVDSGPAHAGAAVGCPQVVLFGKASTSLYRPWGSAGAPVRVLTGEVDGEPSMLGIDAHAVIEAWDSLALR